MMRTPRWNSRKDLRRKWVRSDQSPQNMPFDIRREADSAARPVARRYTPSKRPTPQKKPFSGFFKKKGR